MQLFRGIIIEEYIKWNQGYTTSWSLKSPLEKDIFLEASILPCGDQSTIPLARIQILKLVQ